MRLLLVHGRAQGGKNENALKTEWIDALKVGFERAALPFPDVTFDFPYYGDALDELVATSKLPNSAEVGAKGPGAGTGYADFLAEVYLQLEGRHPAVDAAAIRAELDQDPTAKGPGNWRWVHAIARAANKHFSGVVDFAIEQVLADVYLYVNNRSVRKAVDNIVVKTLTDEPTIVVGHSLGSVVSYNTIVAQQGRLNVVKHITVGSPLGLRAISGPLGPVRNPATNGWYNAFDSDDIVSLVPLDDEHFPVQPVIVNDDSVDNDTPNQHGISGYLSHPAVAETLAVCLR
ncbi:MAG: alpha/beta hydrolase [Acidimicrobiia bacterium]|nr:alpha/beta hydrolase [Acidimicrobiia bacterium]